ncbi:MAG TPA: hypothetical protein VMN35_03270 [Gaiellaceae bacterium]|nr:hypothetical protein [Gaiellaceae bacterium]
MRVAALRALAGEVRELRSALQEESRPQARGVVVVSGMLAEQLARELGREADQGAVRVGDGRLNADDLAVHVFAGEPSEDDVAYVRSANRTDVPVVLVQLWPQEDWTPPFVLSPFVVECRPGEGFPIDLIAARVVDAAGSDSVLADRVPVVSGAFERRAVREAIARAGLAGLLGGRGRSARPLITREQARLLGRLRAVPEDAVPGGTEAVVAGTVAALEAWGHLLRGVARRARAVVPARLADAAIGAGGTWAVAEAAKALRSRLPHD